MAGIHRSRALCLSIAVVGLVMAAGCLSLTTSQEGGGGKGGAGLSGGTCKSVADCPSIQWCQTMACVESTCVSGLVPASVPCSDNKVCDGAGSCIDCVVDNDCVGGETWCENNQCISCNDGQKNGDETAIDCGGSKCSPCPIACSNASECPSSFCVDGFCCNTACTNECKACNIAGKVGTCTSLPSGTEDPGFCDTTKACSGSFSANCLLKNGQPCMNDSECLSGECSASTNVCENN